MRVALPFDFRHDLHGRAFAVLFLFSAEGTEGTSFPVEVEVFVEAIEEEVEKFFGVLLSVDAPFAIQARAEFAEGGGPDGLDFAAPKAADEVGIDFGHDAVGAFPVLLGEVTPSVVKKKLGERNCGKEALDGGVHVTGYAEVDKTCSREFEVM